MEISEHRLFSIRCGLFPIRWCLFSSRRGFFDAGSLELSMVDSVLKWELHECFEKRECINFLFASARDCESKFDRFWIRPFNLVLSSSGSFGELVEDCAKMQAKLSEALFEMQPFAKE